MRAREVSQRGMSLIEALVATAVLSVAIVVALTVYDASRKAFSRGENATEQQQSVRIAFDLMTSQLRMLGLNINPDGDPNRPDEQLEGALDHAVVFRGDFDQSDPSANALPEAALAGGAFHTVSTGNDEIVAYVLSKPDGTGPDTITFQADVRDAPRDGAVESVSIGNVVLTPTSPPYTLYRITLNNDAAAYGSPGFLVRTPVVENVRDLSFTYDGLGGTFKDASGTISESVASKAIRNGLTRVHVSLVGMTRQPDRNYFDASDSAAPHHRKFELKGEITPRNMRFKGIQDLDADVTPPTKPATPTLVPGHCGGLLVTWSPNPVSEAVTLYRVNWGPSSSTVTGSRNLSGSPVFLDQLTMGASYFVSVQALDARGNISVKSDSASATVANVNAPSEPSGFTTSTDETYHVRVSFTPVTTNASGNPSADPLAPRIRDLAGYRLYWDSAAPFTLADADGVVGEDVLGPSFAPPFLDEPLVACEERFYQLTAVDTCGIESSPTPISRGVVANSGIKPNAPTDVQAHYIGPSSARVKWRPVTRDVDGKGIKIESYEVFRSTPTDGTWPPGSAVWRVDPIGVAQGTSYTDNAVPILPPGNIVYYRVTGRDSCGNSSDPSSEARLDCAFTGDVEFVTPAEGQRVSSGVPVTVRVVGGTDSFINVVITYAPISAPLSPERTFNPPPVGTSWTDSAWTALQLADYTITATVTNASGCSQSSRVDVTATRPQAPD